MRTYHDKVERNGVTLMIVAAILFCYSLGYLMGHLASTCGAT